MADSVSTKKKKAKKGVKGVSRCKSIMEMMALLPMVIAPSKNICCLKSKDEDNKTELKSNPPKQGGKSEAVGPNFPNEANVEYKKEEISLPWRKLHEIPKTNFHCFRTKELENFMEEYPLLINTSTPPLAYEEYVEDWTGSLKGTHAVLPLSPLYRNNVFS